MKKRRLSVTIDFEADDALLDSRMRSLVVALKQAVSNAPWVAALTFEKRRARVKITLEISVPDAEADRELLWGKALAIEKNVKAMLKVHYGGLYSVAARVVSDDGEVLA